MIARDDHSTIKQKLGGDKYIYDVEREQLQSLDKDNTKLMKILYEDDGKLKSSKQKFLETQTIKEELRKFKETK